MQMLGRKYVQVSAFYRYGFNGQEKEKGLNENITTAEFWEYDSRTGRRWNVDPKPNMSTSQYSCFGNNPILFNDVKGDTLRGVNAASAQKQLNVIQDIFKDNEDAKSLFKLESDGVTFKEIGAGVMAAAVEGLSDDLKDLAFGYMLSINDSHLQEVSYIKQSDPSSITGLNPVKHAAYITFLNTNAPTTADLITNYGGQTTLPSSKGNALSIFLEDYNPILQDLADNKGVLHNYTSNMNANNIHEVLGHGLATMLNTTSADGVEALQFENIYYRIIGLNMQRDGSDHQNGTVFGAADRSATPATLIGNRTKQVKVSNPKMKYDEYEYESY
jgi:hypothetical protein